MNIVVVFFVLMNVSLFLLLVSFAISIVAKIYGKYALDSVMGNVGIASWIALVVFVSLFCVSAFIYF